MFRSVTLYDPSIKTSCLKSLTAKSSVYSSSLIHKLSALIVPIKSCKVNDLKKYRGAKVGL